MSSIASRAAPRSLAGEPAWEIAMLFPAQGSWTEQDYLSLEATRLVEFSDGAVEVLPTPTLAHQWIVRFLLAAFETHIQSAGLGGTVVFAPLPVRLWPGKYREPDLVYLSPERLRGQPRYPDGADLAVEVVSDGADNREQDLVTKRAEYAAAGISEYWIVDPEQRTVTVLTLSGDEYAVHGKFSESAEASSVRFPGLTIPVSPIFEAADGRADGSL